MGVEAFGRILAKVRSGTLNNVAERLSETGSDEAMALQYVRDQFDNKVNGHARVFSFGNVEDARYKIFNTDLDNDFDYINAIKGHQYSEDLTNYNKAFYSDLGEQKDVVDFIDSSKVLTSSERAKLDADNDKLNEIGDRLVYNKEIFNENELDFLKNYKSVITTAREDIRSGKRAVSAEVLEKAKSDHYYHLKNNDPILKNSQNNNTSRIISDRNPNYSEENYNILLTARENILQKDKEFSQGFQNTNFRNVINQIDENETVNTNQINTLSDDFDDEIENAFQNLTNDTPQIDSLNTSVNPPPPPPVPPQNFFNSYQTNQMPSFDQKGNLIPPPTPITPPPFLHFNSQNPIVPLPPITPIQQIDSPFVNSQSVNQLSNTTPPTNNSLINQSQTPNPLDQVLNSSSPPTNTNTTKPTQQISPPPPVKTDAEILAEKRKTSHEARLKNNPNYAALHDTKDLAEMPDDGSIASNVFRRAMGGKENIMLQNELIGAARNNNPETVNQRIDFYKNQGVIDDKEAEPLKAFFNTNFENMDAKGVEGWFQQYDQNLSQKMTPRQARLSVNQKMDNKQEGFFSTNSDDNFTKFAGRSIIGGIAGAAIGTATDDNPEAGFVAGMVGASIGRNAASLLRNNTEMFEGKMINSLLKDSAKGKTRPQQLEAVESLDDEALDFMDKMYKDKLTKNFGTSNMFENSAVTGGRAMTLSGAALAGVAFTPKKRDHRRGFNANRGNRI